jgi:DNA helicase-2/ATP-dependent DNA helicase PcrA
MITKEFEEAYKRLNKAQKEAVDTIEGPVLVAAGPGTGKTQILALRIANILLKTDVKPENILAITFTESGVLAMRRRLAEVIGTPAYAVAINTFHGFCNDIIKDEPESFPNIIGATNITDVDQIRILEEILSEGKFSELVTRNDLFYYLRAILSAINELKREGVSVERFQKEIKQGLKDFESIPDLYNEKGKYAGQMKTKYADEQKRLRKNEELGLIYEAYQAKLREEKHYDYTDMISEVADILSENQELLLKLQEQYQYILVDEHQDTNNAQNKVIELLANYFDNPNLFVVGDDKQAIYRFQGASLENFLYFKKKYPELKLIVLEENYRSSQMILDTADSLLSGDKKLKSKSDHEDEPVKLCEFSQKTVEEYFLAQDIGNKIKSGVAPEQIAVFYRDNRDVFAIAKALEQAGVPVIIESDQDILSDVDLRKLITLFRAVDKVGDEKLFAETLHIDFLNLPPLEVYKLIQESYKKKISILDLAKDNDIFSAWYKKFISLSVIAKNDGLSECFEHIVRESGFLNYLLSKPETVEKIEKLNGLFAEAKGLIERHKEGRLSDFIAYLDLLVTHNILLKKSAESVVSKRVRLMTAHKSKGLEFDHIYITYAYDGHWGNKKKRDLIKLPRHIFSLTEDKAVEEENKNDDERRLFYVALTRARKSATITYSRQDENKRELLPSQFIGELNPDLTLKLDVSKYEQEFAGHPEMIFSPRISKAVSVQDKEFVKSLFLERGLAVTHLNNYLKCPWNYFYTNLLRLPKALEPHLMFGTAIHGALEDFFKKFGGDEDPDKAYLLTRFEDYLSKQPLMARDYGSLLERGEKDLGGYYDFWEGQWRTQVLTEFNVPGVLLTPEIRLTGKIDKIEFLDGHDEVNVVDYKTGKPKTRGYVEGSTKNSEGDIKRQIVFYKLLLDNTKYKMVSATIDFVEPDEKGKYKKENFTVMREEEEELIALIKKVSAEILSLDFWDKKCDDPECEFCSLREMMK